MNNKTRLNMRKNTKNKQNFYVVSRIYSEFYFSHVKVSLCARLCSALSANSPITLIPHSHYRIFNNSHNSPQINKKITNMKIKQIQRSSNLNHLTKHNKN